MRRLLLFAGLWLALATVPLYGQAQGMLLFEDDFETENPCEEEWKCIGNGADETDIARWATWFSPDEDPCDEFADPPGQDCRNLFDPPEGYVRLTGPVGNARANMWRRELLQWDNFRLTAEVELLGGSATPADGMAITIIGDDMGEGYVGAFADEIPGEGQFAGGGGMSATGHGLYPTMIFEFDNWDNGGPDINNNHVGFEYEPGGFPPTDQVPSDAVAAVPNNIPLNGSGRFFFEVLFQRGTVACNLTNEDAGLAKTRMFTYKIPDFEPFEGYLGLSGSTGGANQNHIVHSISAQTLPPGFCLAPPLTATRQITPSRDPATSSGDYGDGDEIGVAIVLSDLRAASQDCDAAGDTRIIETLPADWTVKDGSISDGGVYDAAENSVNWVVPAAELTEGKTVSYTAVASHDAGSPDFVVFIGRIVEDVQFAEPVNIQGKSTLYVDSDFDACGGLKAWNILGGFAQSGGAAPGEDAIRADYLTDGQITELEFLWFPGATIDTDFNGESPATGLISGDPASNRNPSGVPEVIGWNDDGGWVDLNGEVYGGAPDNVMAYLQTYVLNTGDPVEVNLGVSSDDAVQVILNEEEVWINSAARGGSNNACAPQDLVPDGLNFIDPLVLEGGANSLIVKVFEGGGDWNTTITFLDTDNNNPILGGDVNGDGEQDLFLQKLPPDLCVTPPLAASRSIGAKSTVDVEGEETLGWQSGDAIDVEIAVSDVREAGGACTAPASVTVRETVPDGFAISGVTPAADVTGQDITWTLATPVAAQTLSYTATAGGPPRNVKFGGSVLGAGDPTTFAITGDSTLANPSGFSAQGFINSWVLLGPYRQSTGFANPDRAAPGEDSIREDWLTDGATISELEVQPVDGDTVNTDFRGAAAAIGIHQGVGSCGLNPGDPPVPTWAAWNDADDTIVYEDYYCGDVNDIMMYALTYVISEEAVTWDLGLGSDDSVQVLVNDVEVWINNIPRGYGVANEVQDVVPAVDLQPGVNKIMVKVFEGGGGHGFRLRFQDPITSEGITEGLCVVLDPTLECPGEGGPPEGASLRPGDVNNDGGVNISDPVSALNALFGGLPLPPCYLAPDGSLDEAGLKVLDWNGDGSHNIADPVASLNSQFGGGAGHVLGTGCVVLPSQCADVCQ